MKAGRSVSYVKVVLVEVMLRYAKLALPEAQKQKNYEKTKEQQKHQIK